MNTVITKTPLPCEISRREILRYAGARASTAELDLLIEDCILEASGAIEGRIAYVECEIETDRDTCDFGHFKIKSHSLAKNLSGCRRAIILAATAGIGIDRLIRKHSHSTPSRALIINALGTERIEAVADAFEAELKNEGYRLRQRFSPGYGDLPLEHQRDIITLLDTPRRIGLFLNASLLLSPSKSITAIIGIEE